MIGRKYEQGVLEDCLLSGRAEFLVVYGRRRVGKTYLIKEYFKLISAAGVKLNEYYDTVQVVLDQDALF